MKPKPPSFTKQELVDYITQRGYTADTETWWEYLIVNEFKIPSGKLRIPLKKNTWKAYVNMRLRKDAFNSKLIPKPESSKPKQDIPEEELATPEQIAEIREKMKHLFKMPPHGHKQTNQSRNENLDKLNEQSKSKM